MLADGRRHLEVSGRSTISCRLHLEVARPPLILIDWIVDRKVLQRNFLALHCSFVLRMQVYV